MLLSILAVHMESMNHPYLYFFFLMLSCVMSSMMQTYLQSATMNFCTRLDIGGGVMSYMLLGQALNGALGSLVNLLSSWLAARSGAHGPTGDPLRQNKKAAMAVFAWTLTLQCLTLILFRATLHQPAVQRRMEMWRIGPDDAPMQGSDTTSWPRIVSVQKRIVTWSASLFGLFLVTLTVYPGLTSRVRTLTQVPWLQNPSVFVAWHMVAMNTGDLLGRRLPVLLPWLNVRDSRIALGTMLLRTLYVPAVVACHVRSDQTQSFSDTFFFVMVFTLGLTSGLLSTSFLVSGPQSVHGSSGVCMEDVTLLHEQPESQAPNVVADEDAAIASMLLSFWLVCGLAVGASVSLVTNMLMR